MTTTEIEPPELPQDLGRLRSGPHRRRPGADPPLLPEERLRRFPDRLDRRGRSTRPRGGYIITITLSEGEQYRVGSVEHRIAHPRHRHRGRCAASSRPRRARSTTPSRSSGRSRTSRPRWPAAATPSRRSARSASATRRRRTVQLGYVIEEGPRVYIERINVRGNTRTRDYVIRREFDVGEGDAYNKVLVDRAERRLNNLGYFKRVRITNEPGSAPDRVVVNIDVEDQSTGAFSVSGGYSTADGFIGEVSVSRDRTSSAAASSSASPAPRPALAGRRLLVHRAVLPRLPPRGRHRPVLEVQRPDEVRPLREPRHRRPAPPRPADHGGVRRHAALLALPAGSQSPERLQAALQRLHGADPGLHRR